MSYTVKLHGFNDTAESDSAVSVTLQSLTQQCPLSGVNDTAESDYTVSMIPISHLGSKKGKAVKNCQKHGENKAFFHANCLFFFSEIANHERITLNVLN